MKLAEAMSVIADYENDFSEIESILNSDLTPSEKCDEIAEIVIEPDEEGQEGDEE